MKKYKWIILSLFMGMALTGCQNSAENKGNSDKVINDINKNDASNNSVLDKIDNTISDEERPEITGDFSIKTENGKNIEAVDGIYTISAAGEYIVSGVLENGRIIVETDEDSEVSLVLNNTSVSCKDACPINIVSAGSVKIKSEEGSSNEINDTSDSEDKSAVYATCDLAFTGKGSLLVISKNHSGIQTKKDLTIKNVTLKVYAGNNGIKGNDSVKIDSGNILVVAQTGSGIKTENTDISSKGNQRGIVTINGGTIDIAAAKDGINAAYDIEINTENSPVVTIKCDDDGMHADNVLTVNGGSINIANSNEGMEANQIIINDGDILIYSNDDGMNAKSGDKSPLIKITGGNLDVTTPGGDTDAVDSNGNYEQTGGNVIVKSGANMGGMAGSVDVDGKITVTGGTIIALGGICETPEESCNSYATNQTQFSAGKYKVESNDGKKIMEFELVSDYSSGWICSEYLETNSSYTITKDGEVIISWTQEEGSMGYSGGGFGGGPGGNMGGGPGGDFGGNRGERPGHKNFNEVPGDMNLDDLPENMDFSKNIAK